jgi:hypothetical protein
MNRLGYAFYSVQYSTSEGLIECQYYQYPLYLYPDVSVETPMWTLVTWRPIMESILNQRALLNMNIVNIHYVCTQEISVETPIWTVGTWPNIQYSILIQKALLNVNIVKFHYICIRTFPFKLQYEV